MQLLQTLDKFSDFGLPIELTELSLNMDDRQLQSDYLRDFMTVAFSHPNVKGVMLWGFLGEATLAASGGAGGMRIGRFARMGRSGSIWFTSSGRRM